jgi:hypothetical protein
LIVRLRPRSRYPRLLHNHCSQTTQNTSRNLGAAHLFPYRIGCRLRYVVRGSHKNLSPLNLIDRLQHASTRLSSNERSVSSQSLFPFKKYWDSCESFQHTLPHSVRILFLPKIGSCQDMGFIVAPLHRLFWSTISADQSFKEVRR